MRAVARGTGAWAVARRTGAKAAAALLALALAAAPAAAQDDARPGRPGILAATGLLTTETLDLPATGRAPALRLEVPSSDQVRAEIVTAEDDASGIAAIRFRTGEGRVVETLVLTDATITADDPVTRAFVMANLLVLRTFPALAEQAADARLLRFGPVARGDDPARPDAVQSVGTFTGQGGEAVFFRHVGLSEAGSDRAVVALITIDADLMPVRGEADLDDTYTGRALDSLRFVADGE